MPDVPQTRITDVNVVVVGGGTAGLSIAGALKHDGIDSIILDAHADVGDVWRNRYDRLHLHTMRAFSGLAYFPIARTYPRYLSRDQFVQYLQDYVHHFNLQVTTGCSVSSIRPDNGHWLIESSRGTWRANVVVVATGQYSVPLTPSYEGRNEYRGQLLHSVQYKSGQAFAGQRALVIGSGNSGTEIAVDLVEQGAAFVANSIRTPPPIVPREFLGTPVQLFGIAMSPLPARIADRLGAFIARRATGDLTEFGVRPAVWQPFTSHKVPIIDVGWLPAVKARRIHLREDITRLTSSGVEYQNGTNEAFDVIVSATGFTTGLSALIDAPGLIDARGYPRYRSGFPTNQQGLYFMGYTESTRGHLFEANRDSKRLATRIKKSVPNRLG